MPLRAAQAKLAVLDSYADREQLGELVARLASRPMDRGRPLWEWYVIEGLESGHIAHYAKTHHATIDGASGNEMMTILLDETPDPRPVPRADEPETRRIEGAGPGTIERPAMSAASPV